MPARPELPGAPFAMIALLLSVLPQPPAQADTLPFEGFLPFVGLGLTDEFDDVDIDPSFFLADPSGAPAGTALPTNSSAYYDLALLDTGAGTHILTSEADGPDGFDISGSGFDGLNTQKIGGATGTLTLTISDPLGVYVAGLADRLSDAAPLAMNPGALRGQTSVSVLSAPPAWTLPNIVGLPMAAQHAIHIRNSAPQVLSLDGRTLRTPQIDLLDLGTGGQQGIPRRAPLVLKPGIGFVQGPLYVQNIDLFGLNPFYDNPLAPTVVDNGGLFIEVDLANHGHGLHDQEFLFDTGASLTILSEQSAVRLGFDPVLDTAVFTLDVQGSGGVQPGIPGFYLERLTIDTIGGTFTADPMGVISTTETIQTSRRFYRAVQK